MSPEPKKPAKEDGWEDKMEGRRGNVRLSKVEKDVGDLTEMVSELLARVPDRPTEDEDRRPMKFETPEGRAAYEAEADAASSSRRALYGTRKKLKDLYDVTTAGYEAEGDVYSDLHIMHADFIRRRSRWKAIQSKMDEGALGARFLKALPWITTLVVGGTLVYGLTEPANFQFVWLRIASDVRLQVVLVSAIALSLGGVLFWLWRSRKRPKEA